MARKILLPLLGLVALVAGIGLVVRFFTPDETRIRRLVRGMEEAYNRGDPGDCVGPLSQGWRHAGYELDRRMLFGALLQTARERDRETKELLTRVTVDEEAALVTVQDDQARVELEARFERRRGGEWKETWHIRIEGELVDGDGGWEIVKSRHQDLSGTHLGR